MERDGHRGVCESKQLGEAGCSRHPREGSGVWVVGLTSPRVWIWNGLQAAGFEVPINHLAREKGRTMRASMSWDGTGKKFVKRVAAFAMLVAVLAPNAALAKPQAVSSPDVVEVVYSLARGSSWS